MTKTKVFQKFRNTTEIHRLKKDKLHRTFATSFSKARSTFTLIPSSFKFLPSIIRNIINGEPQVIIRYQISKLHEFPSFYQVKIYSTFQNARTGKVTKQPTQIWEFVKDNDTKQYIGTKRTPFDDFIFSN